MAGKRYEVNYGEMVAVNFYQSDGYSLIYEITIGQLAGNTAKVNFEWHHLHDQTYAISWQELDGSTVVHIDDFKTGNSLAFFTTSDKQFFRLEGTLCSLDSN
jgi:hypothetical protein